MARSISSLLLLSSLILLSLQNRSYIGASESLYEGQTLMSVNGGYELKMQPDGNAVLYISSHNCGRNALWTSGTSNRGSGRKRLELGTDGNLVLKAGEEVTWSSNTINHGAGGYYLLIQNDANLVIYDRNNKAIWASNTIRV